MFKALLPLAALVTVSAVHAQEMAPPLEIPALTIEQQANLRCGVAFAFVASQQDSGVAWALELPAMEPRGKEFFVRTMAQIMEDERFTRDVMTVLLTEQATSMGEEGADRLQGIMPACLSLLDASGL